MAESVSIIGRTTRVRGRVTGQVSLEVHGFVDGEIAVEGDVTVDTHGLVGAGVRGRRLLVRGAVRGDLTGEEAVLLEDGARVVGDVRAPRVVIAPGALVRGFVDTSEGAASAAARQQPAARPVATSPRVAPAPVRVAVEAQRPGRANERPAAVPPKPVAAAAAKPVEVTASAGYAAPPAAQALGANHAPVPPAARRPPPPVVPALKKAKGQIAKKKER
jgi:cytoskeletal protein CcmA (bactofilin family)